MNIDIDRLRHDLEEHFMEIMFNVAPAAMIDLEELKEASDEEIIEKALANGFDLNDYKIGSKRRFL